ncbi:hypothetical protein N7532_009097 [Penicillium argentinense]|uniref:Nuclear control of ATPase protein 2 n=1 Tax=Penicillium argentinense TaxID=1131581 RepID=A0A9W9EYN4_9EURO|nr:uncharacterized protein N7532_009097 [Penicillium argentinense]KAJ5090413.1 hypothetical protein N7532_009097 [Penicillium argentinense]
MSVVQENACYVSSQLDRLQQQHPRSDETLYSAKDAPEGHFQRLQQVVHSISVTSKTQPLLSADRLADLLSDPVCSSSPSNVVATTGAEDHVSDQLWLVAGKAAVQTSGMVMHTLLKHTIRIHNEIHYWDEILGSVWYSGMYAAQTSPVRLWHWTREIYTTPLDHQHSSESLSRSMAARWACFYQIARQSISESPARWSLSVPIRSSRSEARKKRDRLLAMKDISTSSLGLLMEVWHSFHADASISSESVFSGGKWQDIVYRTIALTEAILQHGVDQSDAPSFEQQVFTTIEKDITSLETQRNGFSPTAESVRLIERLVRVLRATLPDYEATITNHIEINGRPNGVIRYWLPVMAALFSSSASLRFILLRQDEILQWIMNIGSTIIDFGQNWVLDPIHKLIGTIRHDEKSEIAIMSKDSLVADRASLERMVIDFVRDRPDLSPGSMVAEDAMAITNAVREGDLTPVLKAYERDLRAPFKGTVRGDLIRALLIQIQKTKVDVEIAISGINALLKSQELVFGFVGLTPGILVSYSSLRWLFGAFGSRRGLQRGKRQSDLRRGLRNASRILTSASTENGVASFKDSGRLICEAENLLQKVQLVLGGVQYREFREDIQDLLDVQSGIEKQLRVVERMRWTYCH